MGTLTDNARTDTFESLEVIVMAKEPVNLTLTADWVEYLRDVAWWTRRTLLDLLEEGARLELAALEKEHNDGKKFPAPGKEKRTIPRERGVKKVGLRTKLDGQLYRELLNASYWCEMAYSSIVTNGTDKIIAALEKQHNKGKKFSKRESELASSPKKKEEQ